MSIDTERFIEGLHDYLAKAFAPLVERARSAEARADALAAKLDALERRLDQTETATIQNMLESGR